MQWPFHWIDHTTFVPDNYDNEAAREEVCLRIDSHLPPFDRRATWVAASGFLTDSYNLFATNIILPTLAFLYWQADSSGRPELLTNVLTLAGSIIGQLIFGLSADLYGRRRLYGLELSLVLVGTLAMFEASSGLNGSMDIKGWIYFARFLTGIGIGAEYPLSAVITAEFAPVTARARMMAAVFLMQPLGQIIAAGVGWAALAGITDKGASLADASDAGLGELDIVWRSVVAAGAFPALVAILWRFSIPESPRYTMDVEKDGRRAIGDIYKYTNTRRGARAALNRVDAAQVQPNAAPGTANRPTTRFQHFHWGNLKQYFWTEGNWRYLAATSLCWFLLDFAFYGLGINDPTQLNAIFADSTYYTSNRTDWNNPYANTTSADVYVVLTDNASQYIYTICIASLVGSLAMLYFIDTISRKAWLIKSFLILAVLFGITAAILGSTEFTPSYEATVVFYALCQFFFNFGPNTLTFIIPAEIFPTRYRCSCHGISAAFGKLGSIAVLLLLNRPEFGDSIANTTRLRIPLGVFAGLMALGAFIAWIWLPDVQGPFVRPEQPWTFGVLPNKTLETLAKGREWAIGEPPTQEELRMLEKEDVPLSELSKDDILRLDEERRNSGSGGSRRRRVGEGQRIGFRAKMAWLMQRITSERQPRARTQTQVMEAGTEMQDRSSEPGGFGLGELTEEPEDHEE